MEDYGYEISEKGNPLLFIFAFILLLVAVSRGEKSGENAEGSHSESGSRSPGDLAKYVVRLVTRWFPERLQDAPRETDQSLADTRAKHQEFREEPTISTIENSADPWSDPS